MKYSQRFRSTTSASALVCACLGVVALHATTIKGVVEDADGTKVPNATVWLIPAADVAAMAKTPVEVKRDSKNDEPLEDNLAANRDGYPNGTSDDSGAFAVEAAPDGRYFLYVEPADARYLPGGDK